MALLVLLGSMGAAQAQPETDNYVVIEMATQPQPAARMGGGNEMSGSIWLTFSTGMAAAETTVTLKYSVPLAEAISESSEMFTSVMADVKGTPENADNDGNGTVVISGFSLGLVTLVIRNVMLDVSSASGPVTVMAEVTSSDVNDFIRIDGPNIGTVISDIVVGVKVTPTASTVRTRGTASGGAMATLTLAEAYTDAFMMGDELEIKFFDIPDDATLTAEVTGIKIAVMASDDDDSIEAVMTDNDDPYATVSVVSSSGSATVMLGGDDMSDENNLLMRVAPDKVVLNLTLTAKGPLDVGEVTAEVTFAGDDFTKVFTDPATVFNIRPAQCELLFPVVSVTPNDRKL